MEEYLKNAYKNYSLEENEEGVNPISRDDAEIINNISKIIYRMGNGELYSIVSNWKNLSDREILDSLIDYLSDSDEIKGGLVRKFILFSDSSLDIRFITDINKKDIFHPGKCEYEYLIILNKDVSEQTPYYCKTFKFSDKDDRDDKFNQIHELLAGTNSIKFY